MRPADLQVILDDRPGALADFGETLGAAGVSLEGGGVFTHRGEGIAHFLVDDPERGREALQQKGFGPVTVHDVVTLRLDQEIPGQLGAFTRRVARAGINIVVQYSDHDHRLVLVPAPGQHARCEAIAAEWDTERDQSRRSAT